MTDREKSFYTLRKLKGDITDYYLQFMEVNKTGVDAIKKKYEEIYESAKDDYMKLTWLICNVNKHCWLTYEAGFIDESKEYNDLYYKAKEKYLKKFGNNQEAISYFIEKFD